CVDPIVENNTIIRDTTTGLVLPDTPTTPVIRLDSGSGGVVRYNALMSATEVTADGTQSGQEASENVFALSALEAAFNAPAYGAHSNTFAKALAAWAMKAGGPLDAAVTGYARNCGSVGTGYFDYEARVTSLPE